MLLFGLETNRILTSLGSKQLGCGYVEVLASVVWSNSCEDISQSIYVNSSLTITTPLAPTSTVKYKWECSRTDSAECYTTFGKLLTMQGTVTMTPVSSFMNGVGDYVIIANVTDANTGEWSCRRYSINVDDFSTSTATESDSTSKPSDNTKSSSDGTTSVQFEKTTLGQNVVSSF